MNSAPTEENLKRLFRLPNCFEVSRQEVPDVFIPSGEDLFLLLSKSLPWETRYFSPILMQTVWTIGKRTDRLVKHQFTLQGEAHWYFPWIPLWTPEALQRPPKTELSPYFSFYYTRLPTSAVIGNNHIQLNVSYTCLLHVVFFFAVFVKMFQHFQHIHASSI